MVQAIRNEDILIDMKGRCDALREHVDDVVVRVRAVVEFGAKRILPFLSGNLACCIRRAT